MYIRVSGMKSKTVVIDGRVIKDSTMEVNVRNILELAADRTHMVVTIGNNKGNAIGFTIKPNKALCSGKYQRTNPQNGHKQCGSCYHAYLDYLREVYEYILTSEAVIDTGFYLKLRYEGQADFEVKKRVVGNTKIGSEARNKAYYLCCTCNRDVEGNPL